MGWAVVAVLGFLLAVGLDVLLAAPGTARWERAHQAHVARHRPTPAAPSGRRLVLLARRRRLVPVARRRGGAGIATAGHRHGGERAVRRP